MEPVFLGLTGSAAGNGTQGYMELEAELLL